MCLITKTRLDSETETLIPTTGGGFDVAQPTAYNITFCDANGVRSDRPNGGLYVNETDVSSTLTNAGVGTNVVQPVAIQGTLIGRGENAGPQGSGADVSGAMFTLTKTDVHAVAMPMQVRRLTAEECEKLQGFLPGYTNIPWRGKPESPDGPRYKALGNSMAVPVMRYIGERINKVEAL